VDQFLQNMDLKDQKGVGQHVPTISNIRPTKKKPEKGRKGEEKKRNKGCERIVTTAGDGRGTKEGLAPNSWYVISGLEKEIRKTRKGDL